MTGWWFGTWLSEFYIIYGSVIIPTDSIFPRGRVETTNQMSCGQVRRTFLFASPIAPWEDFHPSEAAVVFDVATT